MFLFFYLAFILVFSIRQLLYLKINEVFKMAQIIIANIGKPVLYSSRISTLQDKIIKYWNIYIYTVHVAHRVYLT